MNTEEFVSLLRGVKSRGFGTWSARCTSHEDRSRSLSIRKAGNRTLVHCFSGCEPHAIVSALGLTMADLFTDRPTASHRRPPPSRQRMDHDAVVFRFELAALDRRLRAERVLNAVATFNADELTDEQRDQLMEAVTRAYEDQERAEFLETVADDFRLRAFQERTERHAASH